MTRSSKPADKPVGYVWPHRLELLALFLVLCVLCARGVVQERSDLEALSVINQLHAQAAHHMGPGPLTSLIFNGLILVAMACCSVSIAMRGRWPNPTRSIALASLIMAVAAGISLAGASNLRLAVNESIDRLAALMVLLIVAQTVRRWWQVRLMLAAVGATGAAFAIFCITQVGELEDTKRWIAKQKQEAIESGRVRADDPMLTLLERRAAAGEVGGFFAHSNIAGGFLMGIGLATLGLGVARVRNGTRRFRAFFGAMNAAAAVLMGVGVALSQSRGAMAAGLAVAGLWLLITLLSRRWSGLREWAARRWKVLLATAWLGLFMLLLVVATVGVWRGGLPGGSLSFRWHYWSGAARIFAKHPWTGVGAGNFDRHYVTHKPAIAPEEVKDPHNFFASMASEWGALGLAGACYLLVAVSVAVARPAEPQSEDRTTPPRGKQTKAPPTRGGMILLWLAPLALCVLAGRTVASPDPLWLIWALVPTFFWGLAMLGLALDSDQTGRFENDPLPLLAGLAAALIAVLLHNLISFSLVYPGSACTFFALAGLAVAVRSLRSAGTEPLGQDISPPSGPGPARRRQTRMGLASSVVLAAAVMYWPAVVTPVARASHWIREARSAEDPDRVIRSYQRAIVSDPLDPIAASELARRTIRYATQRSDRREEMATLAVQAAKTAVIRDRADNRHYRTLSSAYMARYAAAQDPNDADRAAMAMEAAAQRYLQLPTLRLDYAEALVLQATVHRDEKILQRAVEQFALALELDDRQLPREPRRFGPARREAIRKRMRDVKTMPTRWPSKPLPIPSPSTSPAQTPP